MPETVQDRVNHRMVGLAQSGRFPPQVLTRFSEWVSGAPEEQLFRCNPVAWAPTQGLSEKDSIDLFVNAARAGIFDFSWGVVCPTCSSYITSRAGLRSLSAQRTCQICNRVCSTPIDDGVEVTFTVNPAVRRIRFHGNWREGGDLSAIKEDVLRIHFADMRNARSLMNPTPVHAAVLDNQQSRTLDLDLDPTFAWMTLAPAVHGVVRLKASPEGSDHVSAELHDGFAVPNVLNVRPGKVKLTLKNHTGLDGLLAAVFQGASDDATKARFQTLPPPIGFLSGKRLLSNQAFRELFRTETIPPDSSLDVRSLAFLFTDLKASTQLYERVGDLAALAMVRRHFHVLTDVVARRDGAVVKTIGDAVMATFSEPRNAAEAGVEMHRAMRRELARPEELVLKVGVHTGPCIAIDSNERLDYFGQTVNIAARVQALAEGRELVCTDALLDEPGVREAMTGQGITWTREDALLKGVSRPVPVHRARVD